MNNYIRYIVMLLVVGVASYFAHTLVLRGLETNHFWEQTDYTLLGMYSFGVGISLFIVVLTWLTQYAMPKNLGFVFLALMTINAIASYIYVKNGLNKFENDFIEYNFLAVFFLFLVFDVFVAFKALNQENNGQ